MSPVISSLSLRDAISDLEGVPQTLSSWDSCMSKAYCKWPVIVGIIIGSLIVLSIVWCFARCLCCGASCCCECFRCCGCLESCTRPREGRGSRPSRYKDDSGGYAPMPYQGYQAPQAPMTYQPTAPQFATFDAPGKRVNEDSLPAMPSWDTAVSKRIEDPTQDMEMEKLSYGQQTGRNGYGQLANGPTSPVHSPYGNEHAEYRAAGAGEAHSYGSDLGARRMGPGPGYADHQATPLSPAPTYNTSPQPQLNTGYSQPAMNVDRFAPGVVSPMSAQYSSNQQYQQYHHSYEPTESTQYEPTEYNGPTMQYQSTSPIQQRPPSLLQVGRKPVNGSVREL